MTPTKQAFPRVIDSRLTNVVFFSLFFSSSLLIAEDAKIVNVSQCCGQVRSVLAVDEWHRETNRLTIRFCTTCGTSFQRFPRTWCPSVSCRWQTHCTYSRLKGIPISLGNLYILLNSISSDSHTTIELIWHQKTHSLLFTCCIIHQCTVFLSLYVEMVKADDATHSRFSQGK